MKFPRAVVLSVALVLGAAVGASGAEGAKAPGKGAAAKKKVEEKPVIKGMEVRRGDGYLGIQIVDSTFKLSFYNSEKKPVVADVDRATLRWNPKYKVGEERLVLNPSADGKALESPKNVRPPYLFKLYLTLVRDAAPNRAPLNETIVVDFRQEVSAPATP
jgi:hypothetical protein